MAELKSCGSITHVPKKSLDCKPLPIGGINEVVIEKECSKYDYPTHRIKIKKGKATVIRK